MSHWNFQNAKWTIFWSELKYCLSAKTMQRCAVLARSNYEFGSSFNALIICIYAGGCVLKTLHESKAVG
jgi:hypothetical protein